MTARNSDDEQTPYASPRATSPADDRDSTRSLVRGCLMLTGTVAVVLVALAVIAVGLFIGLCGVGR